MASTHTCLLYHLVFATKNREPLIHAAWRARLHEYLGGAVRGMGGTPQGIGGIADHVHLLVGLKPTHCLADFMRVAAGITSGMPALFGRPSGGVGRFAPSTAG